MHLLQAWSSAGLGCIGENETHVHRRRNAVHSGDFAVWRDQKVELVSYLSACSGDVAESSEGIEIVENQTFSTRLTTSLANASELDEYRYRCKSIVLNTLDDLTT